MTDHSSLQKEKNNTDIVERLEDYAEDDYYFDHKGSLVTTNRPIALREASAEITRLRAEAAELRSVMIAAAEEIQAHWPAHCDAEGYGPANLMRRLEDGIPSQYAYTAGDFERLRAEAEELRKDAERWNLFTRTASLGFDGSPRWNAVMRFPVFRHDDQTITALVDRCASVYEETKRGQDADNAATTESETKEQQA